VAFFKFRKNGAEQSGPTPAPESLDVLRKRARHRLIGASTLVLLGVVGFPLLFDSQPRPVAVDIAIDIPDKAKAPALTPSPASAAAASAAPKASDAASVAGVAAVSTLAIKAAAPASAPASTLAPLPPPETKASAKSEPKALAMPEPKVTAKPEAKPAVKADEKVQSSGKAQALLDGKDAAKPAAAAKRYAVQVGAFADDKKAHEVRTTLEKAGIKTYTQVLTTADGKRTRVRVGPWENKAEADKAAEKIKKLNLSASVLEL